MCVQVWQARCVLPAFQGWAEAAQRQNALRCSLIHCVQVRYFAQDVAARYISFNTYDVNSGASDSSSSNPDAVFLQRWQRAQIAAAWEAWLEWRQQHQGKQQASTSSHAAIACLKTSASSRPTCCMYPYLLAHGVAVLSSMAPATATIRVDPDGRHCVLQLLLSAVQHLQQAGLARAFATWASRVQAAQQSRAMVQAAVGRWAAAAVGAAFRRWRGRALERAHYLQLATGVLTQQPHCSFTVAEPLAKGFHSSIMRSLPAGFTTAAQTTEHSPANREAMKT